MSIEAIQNINLESLLDTSISLVTAFVLGGVIGYERQYRQRTAGLRTNVLVAVGAAIFVDMATGWPATTARCAWWPTWYPASAFLVRA
jgi:putative Mg2+ transporter-C (MgtC) family protein